MITATEFFVHCNHRSLVNQIKDYVGRAIQIKEDEVNARRQKLRELLEWEDLKYHLEFKTNVETRVNIDIETRNASFLKYKENNKKEEKKDLEKKKIQQFICSSYEMREAMRKEDIKNTKICQFAQMEEKQRRQRKERETEQFWVKVAQKNECVEKLQNQREKNLRVGLANKCKNVLDMQMNDIKCRQEEDRKLDQEYAKKLRENCEKHDTEDVKLRELAKRQMSIDLKDQIAMKQKRELAEREDNCLRHKLLMVKTDYLQREEDKMRAFCRNHWRESSHEYLRFIRNLRELEKKRDDMYDENIQAVQRTSRKPLSDVKEYKNNLQRQICENKDKRIREEIERQKSKILENRFARPAPTHEEVVLKTQQIRTDLDKQIAEIKLNRILEKEKEIMEYERIIMAPILERKQVDQYISENIDYLEPHPNWIPWSCNEKGHRSGNTNINITRTCPQQHYTKIDRKNHEPKEFTKICVNN